MMRWNGLAAAFVLGMAGGPAFAGAYTETIAFSGGPSAGGSTTINGAAFNPALGTLTGVTLTASGTYTPDIFVGGAVPTASVLNVELLTYAPSTSLNQITDGGYALQQRGGYLVGAAEQFSETVQVTDSQALKNFWTGLFPGEIDGLTSVDVFSLSTAPGAWGSQADDVSLFSGELSITYTYAVAEPGSVVMLAVGLAVLAARRKKGLLF